MSSHVAFLLSKISKKDTKKKKKQQKKQEQAPRIVYNDFFSDYESKLNLVNQ